MHVRRMTVALQLTIRNDLAELPRVEELARSLLDSAGIAGDKAFTASVALEELGLPDEPPLPDFLTPLEHRPFDEVLDELQADDQRPET